MTDEARVDLVAQADAALATQNPYGARQLLEAHLGQLAPEAPTVDWEEALGAVTRLAERWADAELVAAGQRARADPEDPAALHDLGHRLVDMEVLLLAVPVLARAVHAGPSPATVAELVAALEFQGRYEEVVAVIEGSGLADSDPLCSFLLGFASALLGDLQPARDRLPGLASLAGEPSQTLASGLAGMLERADALGGPPAPGDLRPWHFVWTGGVLLAPTSAPRRGLSTWSELHGALTVLANSLDRLGFGTGRLLAPPDRGSQILGLAAATLLDRPLETWRGALEPGLLVVHDELDLDRVLRPALRRRPPGQVLYVHVAEAAREQDAAGDLTGTFGLGLRPPWLGGVDDAGTYVAPQDGDPEDLALRVLDATPSACAGHGSTSLIDLVAATGLFSRAVGQAERRSRQWVLPTEFRTPS